MKAIGLQPSADGLLGGKETGPQVSHYILADDCFARAYSALATTGWKLNLESAARGVSLAGVSLRGGGVSLAAAGTVQVQNSLACAVAQTAGASLPLRSTAVSVGAAPRVRGADAGHGARREPRRRRSETPAIPALTYSPTGGVDVPTGLNSDGASRHSPAASARSAALIPRRTETLTIDWPAAYRNVEKRIADNERAAGEERGHFVARAIKSRKRRNLPLDADALAQEAIWLADREHLIRISSTATIRRGLARLHL